MASPPATEIPGCHRRSALSQTPIRPLALDTVATSYLRAAAELRPRRPVGHSSKATGPWGTDVDASAAVAPPAPTMEPDPARSQRFSASFKMVAQTGGFSRTRPSRIMPRPARRHEERIVMAEEAVEIQRIESERAAESPARGRRAGTQVAGAHGPGQGETRRGASRRTAKRAGESLRGDTATAQLHLGDGGGAWRS